MRGARRIQAPVCDDGGGPRAVHCGIAMPAPRCRGVVLAASFGAERRAARQVCAHTMCKDMVSRHSPSGNLAASTMSNTARWQGGRRVSPGPGQVWAGVRRKLAQTSPTLARIRPHVSQSRTHSCRIRPTRLQLGPDSAQLRPMFLPSLADFDQNRASSAIFGRTWVNFW